MTVLCFTNPGIHCNFTVNSLPLSATPSVYAGFMQRKKFTVIFTDKFTVNSLLVS
jgi:hypothetical protein